MLARTGAPATGSRAYLGDVSGRQGASTPLARIYPYQAPPVVTTASARMARRRSIKRRRDVFVGLLVAMAASLVLGAIPALRVLWAVHLVFDLLFAAYVAALVYIRNMAAEREMKLSFLPTSRSVEQGLLLRRSAN